MRNRLFLCFLLSFSLHFGYSQRLYLNDGNVSDFSVVNTADTGYFDNEPPFFPQLGPEVPIKDELISKRSLFHRKLFYQHLISVDSGNFHLIFDPIFNFSFGQTLDEINGENVEKSTYTNTRGFSVRAQITDKVGFTSTFLENQSEFPEYLSRQINESGVVPGQGRAKFFEEGFDYAMAGGVLYIKASDNLSIFAGHGKNKLGNGYRSLFLSENSHNYPYLRLNLNLFKNRLQYFYLGAVFQNLYRLPVSTDTEPPFLRKTANFHYLNWKISEKIRLGFMEATIFENMDSTGSTVFYANQVNPLPAINSLSYGLDGKHNSMVGIDWSYLIFKGFSTYGQLLWDNNQFNRNAIQFGLKWKKSNRYFFLLEHNAVGRHFYGNTNQISRYTHYNQFLAHPSGHGFDESVFLTRLKRNRLYSLLKLNLIQYRNTEAIQSFAGANQRSGTAAIQEFAVGYFINEKNGMSARVGVLNRIQSESNSNESLWFYVGLQTFLPQVFYDF